MAEEERLPPSESGWGVIKKLLAGSGLVAVLLLLMPIIVGGIKGLEFASDRAEKAAIEKAANEKKIEARVAERIEIEQVKIDARKGARFAECWPLSNCPDLANELPIDTSQNKRLSDVEQAKRDVEQRLKLVEGRMIVMEDFIGDTEQKFASDDLRISANTLFRNKQEKRAAVRIEQQSNREKRLIVVENQFQELTKGQTRNLIEALEARINVLERQTNK